MRTMKGVVKPSKQRRMLFQAPDHIRVRHFAAPLSPELKASQGIKTLPVRTGDTVRIMRGDHKGFEGKISRVDRKKYKIYVEGLTREKVDGTAIFVSLHPSKAMITNLVLDDKWRKKVLERKKETRKKALKIAEERSRKLPKVKEERIEEKGAIEEKPKAEQPKTRRKRTPKKAAVEKTEKKKPRTRRAVKPRARKTTAKRKTKPKAKEESEGGQ